MYISSFYVLIIFNSGKTTLAADIVKKNRFKRVNMVCLMIY